MAIREAEPIRSPYATHEVINQAPPLAGYNVFTADATLVEAVRREGAGWAEGALTSMGEVAGSEEAIAWGFQMNRHTPILHTHDRLGNRRDEVEFHPSWHEAMRLGVEYGIHSMPWREPRPGAHVARGALMMVWSQIDGGPACPLSMTYAVFPALRRQPEVAAEWEPRFSSLTYDPRFRPASEKEGALCGMAMTEKQGGSDVRANTTRAEPIGTGGPGGEYLITGHKWFCSAPMCDAFLILAHSAGGLSCFLLPRWTPEGTKNRFFLQRLKDKLGNRSNASSEVEFDRAWAVMVGEEGRGVPTIIEMVNHTRLDCVLGVAALMRQAVAQATHYSTYRSAFGKTLIDQPLMVNVLADLAVESEAATVTAMRLARSYDAAAAGDEREAAFRRMATAVAKYWVCKRAPAHAAEALECLGGNGYVEDSGMPRLFRESPLNSIWEGAGNVNALDALRAMAKNPETVDAFFAELAEAAASDRRLAGYVETTRLELGDLTDIEARARRIVERMALALQAALLLRHGHPAIAEAFMASRIAGDGGRAFGTLPPGLDTAAIVERARPAR